eukprot:3320408-Pyramimonas_sp.AAC.2
MRVAGTDCRGILHAAAVARWEGTDDEGRPWEPSWEPLDVFDPQAEQPEDTLRQFLHGEVVALKDKLP